MKPEISLECPTHTGPVLVCQRRTERRQIKIFRAHTPSKRGGVSDHRLNSRKSHDDVIKWKHFPRYWPFVREIHWSPVNSPHKGQWRGALMFSLICVWKNGLVNNREAGDLRRYRAHYDVTVMRQVNVAWVYNCWSFDIHSRIIVACSW